MFGSVFSVLGWLFSAPGGQGAREIGQASVPAVLRAKNGEFRPKLALYGPETVASGPGKYDPDAAKVGLGA